MVLLFRRWLALVSLRQKGLISAILFAWIDRRAPTESKNHLRNAQSRVENVRNVFNPPLIYVFCAGWVLGRVPSTQNSLSPRPPSARAPRRPTVPVRRSCPSPNRTRVRSVRHAPRCGLARNCCRFVISGDSRAARIMKVHFRRFDKSFAFIGKIRRERG